VLPKIVEVFFFHVFVRTKGSGSFNPRPSQTPRATPSPI
jgi:hypothetical protein